MKAGEGLAAGNHSKLFFCVPQVSPVISFSSREYDMISKSHLEERLRACLLV